jgi:predicted NBD/HSP70 family sugar kinase
VESIVLGGGLPESRFGTLAIRRAGRLLANDDAAVELHVLEHDADEGGLLGWVALLPETASAAHDAFLAVDIGGTNLRVGLVEHGLREAPDGSAACVVERMQWRHAQDDPARDEAVARMAGMLNGLAAQARTLRIRLAPFVGIACPGEMRPDGSIVQGAQNLPGHWEAPFNLPRALGGHLDRIGDAPMQVVMHNDAVVQGLSERNRMRGVKRWGVMTIGTGLGNASYTNQ